MSIKVLILFALANICQAWWSKCFQYENRYDFCARLFSKEDCRGDAMVLPHSNAIRVSYFSVIEYQTPKLYFLVIGI